MKFQIVNFTFLLLFYNINAGPLSRMAFPSPSMPVVPVQDAGLEEDDSSGRLKDGDLVTSANSFYGTGGFYHPPTVNFIPLPQSLSPFITNDLQTLFLGLENSPILNTFFSIENIPFSNPALFQPIDIHPLYTPPKIELPTIPSIENFAAAPFPEISWQFEHNFYDSSEFQQFQPQIFTLPVMPRMMSDEENTSYDVVQVGEDNYNIQNGVSSTHPEDFENSFMSNTEEPMTTTEFPDMAETTTMDTTTDDTTMGYDYGFAADLLKGLAGL